MLAASPVSAKAWHRHPPQSSSRRSHERQGSGIQSVPRYFMNASEDSQIAFRLFSTTVSNCSPVIDSAAWHGRTLPEGDILRNRCPQPPMQAFGRLA